MTAKPTPTQKASLKPSVSAVGLATPLASRLFVRVVDTVVRIASPIPPPICWLVVISPDARPASLLVTPLSAAMDTGTNENPRPTPINRKPGKRSQKYEPLTGSWPANSVSTPPSRRPIAAPEPAIAPRTPSALLRSDPSSNVTDTIEKTDGDNTAPAAP